MTPVAITGIGLLSPLGLGAGANLEALLAGRSGLAAPADGRLLAMGVPAVGAAPAPTAAGLDRVESLALDAVRMALADAGLAVPDLPEATFLAVSTSKGPVAAIEAQIVCQAAPRLSLERLGTASAGALLARELGVRGAVACFPAACATGLVSVLAAAREVASGRAELALAGASESSLTPFIHAGFLRMGALAVTQGSGSGVSGLGCHAEGMGTRPPGSRTPDPRPQTPDPRHAVRPFDRARRGFLLGEGAAVFVLEPSERVERRGGRVRAALAGGAEACDAWSIAAPEPEGLGLEQAARLALERAGCRPGGLDGLWLHGTGTMAGDEAELAAVSRLLSGAAGPVHATATKGLTGHMLGASGAVELAFAAVCLEAGRLPAVAGLDDPLACPAGLRLVRGRAASLRAERYLALSAGFGGHSAAAVLQRKP